MENKIAEAKFGPQRYRHSRYLRAIKLLRQLLMIIGGLEKRVVAMSQNKSCEATLLAFLQYKPFRQSILQFSIELSSALAALSKWQGDPSEYPPASALNAMKSLRESLEDMESSYSEARNEIYYNSNPNQRHKVCTEFTLQINGFLFLLHKAGKLVYECERKMCDVEETQASFRQPRPRLTRRSSLVFHARKLFVDLIPPQRQLFQCFGPTISPVITARMRQAFSVSFSMLVAGIYGAYANVGDPTFAAFTICFLAGGAVPGANVITSFNRAVGTVSACVVSLLVAKIVMGWSMDSAKWFIGVIIVLVQFPATYVRSLPKYGYSGTVMGFTVPILLLTYPNFDQIVAMQRIVDTIVAVLIFISVEFSFLAFRFSSEELLLDGTLKVFSDIEKHFVGFVDSFKASLVGSYTEEHAGEHRIPITQSSPSFLAEIRKQHELSKFISIELNLWRPAHFRRGLVQELLHLEEVAHNSIAFISWAVDASHKFDGGKNVKKSRKYLEASEFSRILGPLEQPLEQVKLAVGRACGQMRRGVAGLKESTTLTSGNSSISDSGVEVHFDEVLAIAGREIHEEKALFLHLSSVILEVQNEVVNSDACDSSSDASPINADSECAEELKSVGDSRGGKCRVISSSAEVMIVNTVLVCLRDLLEALSDLAKVIMQMQAYRKAIIIESKYFTFFPKSFGKDEMMSLGMHMQQQVVQALIEQMATDCTPVEASVDAPVQHTEESSDSNNL